jgi:hypothetical protein
VRYWRRLCLPTSDLQFLQHFFNLRNLNIVSNDIVTGRLVSAIVEHAYPKDSGTRICWTI